MHNSQGSPGDQICPMGNSTPLSSTKQPWGGANTGGTHRHPQPFTLLMHAQARTCTAGHVCRPHPVPTPRLQTPRLCSPPPNALPVPPHPHIQLPPSSPRPPCPQLSPTSHPPCAQVFPTSHLPHPQASPTSHPTHPQMSPASLSPCPQLWCPSPSPPPPNPTLPVPRCPPTRAHRRGPGGPGR